MASDALVQATFRIGEPDLEYMALEAGDLPADLRGYQLARAGVLDNDEMAENGFAGSAAERFSRAGRISGYLREFVPTSDMIPEDGLNFVGATVVHLFSIRPTRKSMTVDDSRPAGPPCSTYSPTASS